MPFDINKDGVIDDTDLVYDVGGDNTSNKEGVSEGDDLSKKTKKTLANYLSDLTKGNLSKEQRNEFPISNVPSEFSLTTDSGNPSTLNYDTNSTDGGKQYLTKNETLGLSNPNPVPAANSTTSFIKKGKSDNPALYNGNTLLKNVSSENNDIDKLYTSPVLRNNRFTPTNPISGFLGFAAVNNTTITNQKTFGVYDVNARQIGFDVLKKVGKLMSLRSSGEGFAFVDGFDPDSADATSILLPGAAQAGVLKINTSDFTADDILSSLIGEQFGSNLNENSNDSYGNLNNYLEPFAGLLPLGTMALAVALILALEVSLTVIIEVLTFVTTAGTNNARKHDTVGRYFLGNYSFNPAFEESNFPPIPLPAKLFGLNETENQFDDCVEEGMKVFFGAGESDGGIVAQVGGAFKAAFEAPGFYATLVHNIVRSAVDIGRSIGDISLSNPISAVEGIIGIIDIIKSSKVISAINVFAQIGDNSLRFKKLPSLVEKEGGATRISTMDRLSDDTFAVAKSRLQRTLKLAWSNNRSHSSLMLPSTVYGASTIFKNVGNSNFHAYAAVGQATDSRTQVTITPNNRLDASVVEEIETRLDGEYVPFYFHDLRTNEIISFHAFLTALSDDFSVNWESSEAFGRVDQVKIYKNTLRKISLGFITVATSEQDFDDMWVKINKLITMVYPQWTEGTRLTTADGDSFIQPFTQLMSASPIIRLRLGDLLRTNYSRFALARLFGLNSEKFSINGGTITGDELTNVANEIFESLKQAQNIKVGYKYLLSPGDYEPPVESGLTIPKPPGIGGSDPTMKLNVVAPLAVKVDKILDPIGGLFLVSIDGDYYNSIGSNDRPIEHYDDLKLKLDFSKIQVQAHVSSLKPQLELWQKFVKEKYPEAEDQTKFQEILNFFNDTNNAIIRSFKSVAGKGLACTIDSINFNWDNVTWETQTYGSRAPQLCRISLTLSPIHDIAPGLDSNGFNRAPVYNVGGPINGVAGNSYDENDAGRAMLFAKTRK